MLILEGISVAFILVLASIVLFHHGFPVDQDQLTLKGASISNMGFGVVIAIFSLVGFRMRDGLRRRGKTAAQNDPQSRHLESAADRRILRLHHLYGSLRRTGKHGHPGYALGPAQYPGGNDACEMARHPHLAGAVVSFFSLNLSCMNACARILYPMGRHGVFHASVGQAHSKHQTPHIAVSIAGGMMFLVCSGLYLWHSVVTDVFNYAGTFGAFGFLFSYFFISVAAPMYLKKIGELQPKHIALSVISVLLLLVPAIGSVYTNPPLAPPTKFFPYVFLTYFAIGLAWLVTLRKRSPEVVAGITSDLETMGSPRMASYDVV